MKNIVIVGGGVAGLTAAYNLIKKNNNLKILLFEKDQRLGGLAKSFRYEDKYIFDIGPKRFHTEDEHVIEFIQDIAQHIPLIEIKRSSKVLFLDKYYSWPLTKKDLFKLPIGMAFASARDLLSKREYSSHDLQKFENYILSKYGNALYQIFFKPYTEKFLRIPIHDVHSDWASTGINRSIINKENKGNSFFELVNQIFLPAKVEANFLYPENGGFGNFFDVCAGLLSQNTNVKIATSTIVKKILKKDKTLYLDLSDGSQVSCDHLLWSGRLPDLLNCINPENIVTPTLPYVDTIFINLVFKGKDVVNKDALCQWLYVSSSETCISRISFPKQFNSANLPEDHVGICVEVTSSELYDDFDKEILSKYVITELNRIKVVSENHRPCFINVHKEYSTYPVYHSEYKEETKKAFTMINEFSDQITPFGRSGSFWYNNADHSIRQALSLTDDLSEGKKPYFDFRKYFGGISDSTDEKLHNGI